MSVAGAIPCINLRALPSPANSLSSSSSSPFCSPPTANSSSPSASSTSIRHSFRFASVQPYAVTIRCSQTNGPLRRPVVAPLREPSAPASPAPPSAPARVAPASEETNVITLEFQRLKAKELQDYFKQKKLEEANQGPFFGFIGKNEIANGRWAMFGFAVGMLTEYATGSSFVDQVKILLSNFGILDLE